jgi:outer membrane receptor protein involved in Fe transport
VTVPAAGTVTADFTLEVDALNLEALVVTGTATETRKVEATYSVTNLSDAQIEEKAPQSTAELLEVVPGFYVESSGGQGGNNVWARGIPQDGGFRYVDRRDGEDAGGGSWRFGLHLRQQRAGRDNQLRQQDGR